MLFQFLGIGRYRYSRLRNVRVNRKTMTVERLYVTQIERYSNGQSRIKKTEWREVDYRLCYPRKDGNRPCPKEELEDLIRCAF